MILSDGYDTGPPELLGGGDARSQAPLQAHRLAQSADRPPTASSRARAACRRPCPTSICSRRRTISRASRRSNPIWRGFDMGVLEQAAQRQANGEAFALATVVRTVSVTAAKAGAKALIGAGRLDRGGLDRRRLRARGGGQGGAPVHGRRPIAAGLDRAEGRARRTRRGAGRGARRRLLRQEFLPEPGHDGHFRRAGAAEPAPSDPRRFAGRRRARAAWRRRWASPSPSPRRRRSTSDSTRAFSASTAWRRRREAGESAFVVVSTQGAGDRAALKSAAAMDARYRAFVGSRRKAETLQARTRRGRRVG